MLHLCARIGIGHDNLAFRQDCIVPLNLHVEGRQLRPSSEHLRGDLQILPRKGWLPDTEFFDFNQLQRGSRGKSCVCSPERAGQLRPDFHKVNRREEWFAREMVAKNQPIRI